MAGSTVVTNRRPKDPGRPTIMLAQYKNISPLIKVPIGSIIADSIRRWVFKFLDFITLRLLSKNSIA